MPLSGFPVVVTASRRAYDETLTRSVWAAELTSQVLQNRDQKFSDLGLFVSAVEQG